MIVKETVEMMQGKISGKKKEAIQSLRDHKKELKQQIHDKAVRQSDIDSSGPEELC